MALAVADGTHRGGVATLLLGMVSPARARGVQAFTAEVLADNYAVLRLLSDSGLALRRRFSHGVVDLSISIPRLAALGEASAYLDAVAGLGPARGCGQPGAAAGAPVGRGGRHGSPSRIGRPDSFAQHPRRRIRRLYAVSPQSIAIDGIPCVPSVAALPEAPDLAVVTTPAARVVGLAEECGHRGVRALAVITAGLNPARKPVCWPSPDGRACGWRARPAGVAAPGIGLAATPAAHHPVPGHVGLAVQSGGVGAALLEQFARLGIGISCFRRARRQAGCLRYRHAAVV